LLTRTLRRALGLSGVIWTKTAKTAARLRKRLEAGAQDEQRAIFMGWEG
jgi:hypothetical protein